ncbi:MAG TPA: DMT family transporter [Opitutaceae bacterium]|nr:DMT family transporter [Opitutaceae bacterium]
MPWVVASLVAAFFLGCYDLCIKHSVRDNAVLPVLFFANLCSAGIWIILLGLHAAAPNHMPGIFSVPTLTASQHGLMFIKSLIVAASWVCSYFAVKHLPVSIAAPIRATSPLWTLIGALILLRERPSTLELVGMLTTLGSFLGLSFAGRQEGIHFHRDKWIWWLSAGTLLGGISGLYDKYLLGRCGFTASTVQTWFSIYLVLLFLPLAVGWKLRWWPRHEFHWRWSIIGVSVTLLIADFVYFTALRDPQALVSVVSSLRRGSTLVAFAGGLWLFKEANGRQKLPAVLGVLAGIILTVVG